MINKELQTPYFVVQKEILEQGYKSLVEALKKYWNNYIIGYSFKTNALPWVLDYFKKQGCYAEVVSDDEYELARAVNYSAEKIIYNGPIKTRETFIEAINNGAIVNIDSKREVRWLEECDWEREVKVGLRVNFDLEEMCPGESACGDEGGRFGFSYETGEFERVLQTIKKKKNVILAGLHLHCSSKTRSVKIYATIAEIACEIKRQYQLTLEYVDIGGGFFGGLEDKPQFRDYLQIVSQILKKEFNEKETTIIVEPGMSIIGPSIDFVTTVIDEKETNYNKFIITDGSRINIDPLMNKKSYFRDIVYWNMDKVIEDKQIICGFTCMENDRLFALTNMPKLEEGDKIIYHKVGAYTMCLSPLFIKYFPDVYVYENGEYKKVRSRWGASQYIQNS